MFLRKGILACCLVMGFFTASNAQANTMGVRFNPLSILVGLVDAGFDIGINNNFVVTPTLLFWNLTLSNDSWSIAGIGAEGTYHFDGAFSDGWYLGAHANTLSLDVDTTAESGSLSTIGFGVRGGYLWQWTSFYMNLGGVFSILSNADITVKDKTTSVESKESIPGGLGGIGLDFKLGWSF